MNTNKNYKTQTMNLATFLIVKGFHLSGIERTGNSCVFVFEQCEKLEGVVNSYLFGKEGDTEVVIDARKLFAATRDLKSKIYS